MAESDISFVSPSFLANLKVFNENYSAYQMPKVFNKECLRKLGETVTP